MTVLHIYKEEDINQSNELSCLRDGYHYLGRETPIVCKDKRISRKHAIVVVHRNGAIIKAAHVNPTFFKSSGGGPVQILKENDTLALNSGDCFALLQDSVWFTVKMKYEHEIVNDVSYNTISNKRIHEDNIFENQKRIKIEQENVSNQNDTVHNNAVHLLDEILPVTNVSRPDMALDNISNESNGLNNSSLLLTNEQMHLETSNLDEIPSSVNTPRSDEILPSNNTPRPDADQVNPDIFPRSSDVNEPIESISTDLNITIPINPNIYSSTSNPPNLQMNNATNSLNSICVKQEVIENINSNYTASTVTNFNNTTIQIKAEIKEEPTENEEETCEEINEDVPVQMTDHEPPGSDHDEPTSSTNNSKENPNNKRENCWYGKLCYRKNPVHKANFSHPGDNDYDNELNDIRPICPFGIHCYRRNVAHRRQYRHFGPPAPKPTNINVQNPSNPHQKPGYESSCESDPDDE